MAHPTPIHSPFSIFSQKKKKKNSPHPPDGIARGTKPAPKPRSTEAARSLPTATRRGQQYRPRWRQIQRERSTKKNVVLVLFCFLQKGKMGVVGTAEGGGWTDGRKDGRKDGQINRLINQPMKSTKSTKRPMRANKDTRSTHVALRLHPLTSSSPTL